MIKLIGVVFCLLLLSGCGVTQPAPATQVTAGNSTPMFSTTKWCTASLKDKDNNSIDLGIVFIDDKDNSYVVRNKNNKVVGVSPTLVQTTPTMMVGTLGKITYSKGTGEFSGMYGAVGEFRGQSASLVYNCN